MDVDVRIAETPRRRSDALSVRLAVFVDEQGIPPEEEVDDADDEAAHCVAYDGDRPVGAGRLLRGDGYGKIGRMAVLASHRGHGVGAAVLAALERHGRESGLSEFRLSAQLTARGFYERAGYVAHGDVYDDVGIPHIDMTKRD